MQFRYGATFSRAEGSPQPTMKVKVPSRAPYEEEGQKNEDTLKNANLQLIPTVPDSNNKNKNGWIQANTTSKPPVDGNKEQPNQDKNREEHKMN